VFLLKLHALVRILGNCNNKIRHVVIIEALLSHPSDVVHY